MFGEKAYSRDSHRKSRHSHRHSDRDREKERSRYKEDDYKRRDKYDKYDKYNKKTKEKISDKDLDREGNREKTSKYKGKYDRYDKYDKYKENKSYRSNNSYRSDSKKHNKNNRHKSHKSKSSSESKSSYSSSKYEKSKSKNNKEEVNIGDNGLNTPGMIPLIPIQNPIAPIYYNYAINPLAPASIIPNQIKFPSMLKFNNSENNIKTKTVPDQNLLNSDDKLFNSIVNHQISLKYAFSDIQFSEKLLGPILFNSLKKHTYDNNIKIFEKVEKQKEDLDLRTSTLSKIEDEIDRIISC